MRRRALRQSSWWCARRRWRRRRRRRRKRQVGLQNIMHRARASQHRTEKSNVEQHALRHAAHVWTEHSRQTLKKKNHKKNHFFYCAVNLRLVCGRCRTQPPWCVSTLICTRCWSPLLQHFAGWRDGRLRDDAARGPAWRAPPPALPAARAPTRRPAPRPQPIVDLLKPKPEAEKRCHKKKRLVQVRQPRLCSLGQAAAAAPPPGRRRCTAGCRSPPPSPRAPSLCSRLTPTLWMCAARAA